MKADPANDAVRLRHMLDAAQKCERFVAGKTRDAFVVDEVLTLAVTRLLEIMGEAANQVTVDFKAGASRNSVGKDGGDA